MSETTNAEQQGNQDQRQPTPEEIKAYRDQMLKFYKEETPLLKAQSEYEKLKADIDEHRLRSLMNRIRYAQAVSPPQPPGEPEKPENPEPPAGEQKSERKLKTD